MRQIFQENRRISIRSASAALNIYRTTVHGILLRCLQLHPYEMQNLHLMSDSNREN